MGKDARERRSKASDLRVAIVLVLVALIARGRTFENPVIGFDEQFYLLVGDRLWHGALPFVDVFDRKPVGLFLIYAAAHAMGGDGFVQYKLLALASAVATAFLIYRIALRWSGTTAAATAATLYLAWLDFLEGEGGQSPVFYNLPMVAAAIIVSAPHRADTRWRGALAMTLVGIALQIKYTVVVEGAFFGVWMIAAAWRQRQGGGLVGSCALWIAAALLPTAIAFATYAAIGHADAFVFANFASAFAQRSADPVAKLSGAAVIVGILAPLWSTLLFGWRERIAPGSETQTSRFLVGWFVASIIAVMLYGRYASPHYAMPLLPPLVCLLAPVLGASRMRRIAGVALTLAAVAGGQAVLAVSERQKGGASAASTIAHLAQPQGRGCIWVYDGYPALYLLTRSCLPTRWAFPGHLNTLEEASAAALGIDPAVEVRRILASRPIAIIDDFPAFAGGNPATRRILRQALDADYALAGCVRTGSARMRLVYRLRSEHQPAAVGCPQDAGLRRDR